MRLARRGTAAIFGAWLALLAADPARADGRLPLVLVTGEGFCNGFGTHHLGRVHVVDEDGATLASHADVPLLVEPCVVSLTLDVGPDVMDALWVEPLFVDVEACPVDAAACPLGPETPIVDVVVGAPIDTLLPALAASESSARVAADAELRTLITNEVTTRASIDATLLASLQLFNGARVAADQALTQALDAESSTRAAADEAEATARASADAALEGALVTLEGALAPVAITGSYDDLAGLPDLDVYARSAALPWRTDAGLIYADLAGAPSVAVDQRVAATSGGGIYTSTIWQSFTAGVSGVLSAITVGVSGSIAGVTLTVRAGEGTTGAVLHQRALTVTGGVDIPIGGVDLVAGQRYTIVLDKGLSFGWVVNFGPGYAGGTFGGASGAFSGFDMAFSTTVAVQPGVVVTSEGKLGLGTASPTAQLDVSGGAIRIRTPRSPAAASPCHRGELAWDASWLYVCVAPNTWRRSALVAY
ncbi:MAG: hypothetical protein IT385_13605 [Deltaproteobacteria bacterium]|nr:hypothetical protein [Deltaproteobacteria bacterium]